MGRVHKIGLVVCLGLVVAACLAAETPSPQEVRLELQSRRATAEPVRQGYTHTAGGNIVTLPAPNSLQIQLSGSVMAGPHPCIDSHAGIHFDVRQELVIRGTHEDAHTARATLELRLVGALRSYRCPSGKGPDGRAEMSEAAVSLTGEGREALALSLVPHSVDGGECLGINDHAGPVAGVVGLGAYTLQASFAIAASHPKTLRAGTSASAEFTPEAGLDPLWLGSRDPFHAAVKKDFGLRILLETSPEELGPKKAEATGLVNIMPAPSR